MDNIGSTNKEYKKISTITASIFLAFIQIYLLIISSGIDIVNFSYVDNIAFRTFLEFIVQVVIFSGSFGIIYFAVKNIYSLLWIHRHRNIWIKGLWLHIHIKNEPRVGTVVIKQNFSTISAIGTNIYPNGINKPQRVTKWHYLLAKVNDDQTRNADLIGYYRAGEEADTSAKDGIHILNIENNNEKHISNTMSGAFRDTVRADGGPVDEHSGRLYLFRVDKKTLKFLTDESSGNISYEKLANLHCRTEFENTKYAKKLKGFLEEYTH